jgi:hypothetical protein
MSVPSVTSITIYKGTDFEKKVSIAVTTLDSSSQTALAKIRKHPASENYKTFDTYINEDDNSVLISMASSITSDLDNGRNYFDIIIETNSTDKLMKVVEGSILVYDTVSV